MKTIAITISELFKTVITVSIFTAFAIAQNTFSIEVGDGTIDVLYSSDADIGGFQFNVDGATVNSASGGDAAANGFTISCSSSMCLGFSLTGSVIPAGSGTLVVVAADITGDVSLSGIVVSDAAGSALDFTYDAGEPVAYSQIQDIFNESCLNCHGGSGGLNLSSYNNLMNGGNSGEVIVPGDHENSLLWQRVNDGDMPQSGDFDQGYIDLIAAWIDEGAQDDGSSSISGCTDSSACNYDENATEDDGSCLSEDCTGECGGSAEVDECGECGGDGFSCATSTIDILYNTITDIGGFQFDVDGATIAGASGGAAADAGFTISTGNNTVLAFSFTGATIPAGSGVLVQVEIDGDAAAACLSDVVLSDPIGVAIENEVIDCFTISQVEIILGCTDDTACNYVENATEDDGSCEYAQENYDCDDNCTAGEDCAGECGGSAEVDECGICDGPGIGHGACDCDGNVEDCAGDCGGSAEVDECSVCDGDGTSCIPVQLGFGTVADGNMEITYDSPEDIAGFQFNVEGVTVTSASGGATGENGFMISNNATTVIAFSLTGATIPAGSGVLIELGYEATAEQACLDSPVISDPNGEGLDIEIGSCADLDYAVCDDVDADGICDDVDDCVGEFDECGVCNGDGIADGACDCDGNVDLGCGCGEEGPSGCDNACGSTLEFDECGVCGGDGIADGACDCDGNILDECGECGGDGIADGACDCDGNVEDCAGECGGSAEVDECGECGGDGIADGACDCDGNVEDCAGECGGSAENCPDWQDDPGGYEFVATLVGAVILDEGVQLGEASDLFAAFDGDGNVRGLSQPNQLLIPEFGPYAGTPVYEMTMRSNAAGDLLSFKYYDASKDEVLDISQTYEFVINDQVGNVVNPWEMTIQHEVDLTIDLIAGWNWISLNVLPADPSIGSVLGGLGVDALFINSQTGGSSTNYEIYGGGWVGGLTAFVPGAMYLLKMDAAATLVVTGDPVDVAETPIDLIAGWNWLGYLPQSPGDVGVALESLGVDAIFINSQAGGSSTNYAMYGGGWVGGLATLVPGIGYLLKMEADAEFYYPEFDGMARLSDNVQKVILSNTISDWDFSYADYEFIGNITASIESREDGDGDVVGVFVDGKCRGLAERMYFPLDDTYYYMIQVYSNALDGEELTFKYYDNTNDKVTTYSETLTFENNMIVGDGLNTFGLSREARLSQPKAYSISDAYPNPFNPVTSFEYTMPADGMVQVAVYDISGRMVAELAEGYRSAGSYPVTFDASELSSGVYMVHMIANDFSTMQKIMLIK